MVDLTALYSFKGEEPRPLPEKIRLSDGTTRTDNSSFTEEEILDAGYTGPYTRPEISDRDGMIGWDSENLEYVVTMFEDHMYLTELKRQRYSILLDTDWTQLPDSPLSDDDKQKWANFRQALRDFPETCEDPKNYQLPLPVDFF